MTPDEELQDEILHHTLSLFRLSASEITRTMKRLKAMEKRLVAELSAPLSEARRSEIKQIIANTDDIVQEYYGGLQQEFDLQGIGETVAGATAKSLTIALGIEAVKMPTQAYFKTLAGDVLIQGSPAKDWWNAQSADTAFKVAAQIRQGLANSETNQQIIKRIVGTRAVPGVMDIAEKHAASLVQTSVQAVANSTRLETFRQNSDVISGMMQVSTLDSHTTDICIAYAGATWDLDGNPQDGSPDFNGGPPRHFNCRSVIVPITIGFKDLGVDIEEPQPTTRASEDGQTPAQTTFSDFLDRKGSDYQDEMLGAGRAQMYRDGKITLRDLVNGRGRPLTLGQLQAKFGT